MLPNFFIVGAQKSGTTALHNYLKEHPDIYLPEQKETKFFIENRYYEKGIDFYENEFFDGWNGQSAVGEVDPDYIFFEQALDRIIATNQLSCVKFIFMFRNPVDRAFSHFLMTYRRGLERLSFEEAISQESGRIRCDYHQKMHFSYFSRGLYARQVGRFLQKVPKSRMLLLLTEDMELNPKETINKIFKFLNISVDFVPSNLGKRYHQATLPKSVSMVRIIREPSFCKNVFKIILPSSKLRKKIGGKILRLNSQSSSFLSMNKETQKELSIRYYNEIHFLGKLMGRDLSHWIYK